MTKLFIFGDSHTIAIAAALKLRLADGRGVRGASRVIVDRMAMNKTLEDGRVVTGGVSFEQATEMLVAAGRDSILVSAIGGNAPNGFGMMQHPEAFDYFEPSLPDAPVDGGATLIPCSVVDQQLDLRLREKDWRKTISLRKGFKGRAFHLAPPPPKEDSEFIRRNAETSFRKLGIAEVGVSAPLLRLKLWSLQKRLVDGLCATADIRQLPPPAAALTSDGFLAPAYYGPDATHANVAYGDLVLGMIEDLILAEEGVA